MAIKDKLVSAALGFMTPPEQFEKMYNAKIKSGEKQEERAFDLKKIQFQEGLKQQNKLDYAKLYGKENSEEDGYDTEDQIPRSMGGLPLTGVQKKGGKFVPKYGKMSEDDARGIRYYEDSMNQGGSSKQEEKKPGLLERIFGSKTAPSDSAAKTVMPSGGVATSYNPSTGERLVLNPQTNQWEKPKNAA